MKIVQYCKTWYERAMTEPKINSRLVFLMHGISVAVGTVALVTAFIIVKDKSMYPDMLLALSGSGGIAAAGRLMTKIGDKKTEADAPSGGEKDGGDAASQ